MFGEAYMDGSEQFSGTEKSVFTEIAKDGIQELIESLAKAEDDIINPKGNKTSSYVELRSTLRKVYLLTSEKITDPTLKKDIETWLWKEVSAGKEHRKEDIVYISKLIVKFLAELSAIGLIDLRGGSYNGSYPFVELANEQALSNGIELDNLSEYDQAILKIILSNRG